MRRGELTRDNISRIHGIFILNEAEAIHELDLGDFTCPMAIEVVFNILLGG